MLVGPCVSSRWPHLKSRKSLNVDIHNSCYGGGGERSKVWTACSAGQLSLQRKGKLKLNAMNCIWSVSWIFTTLGNQYHEKYRCIPCGDHKIRFPQKWEGVISNPLLSALGVIVIFSVWITQNELWVEHWMRKSILPEHCVDYYNIIILYWMVSVV